MKFNQLANILKPMTTPVLGGYDPNNLLDINDENLEEKMAEILESDRLLMQRVAMLKPFLNWSEKMAAGLYAYWAIDNSHTQLWELKAKHGEFSAALRSVIDLLQSLSPQAKAEFASDILMEDWEMRSITDSPATLDRKSVV